VPYSRKRKNEIEEEKDPLSIFILTTLGSLFQVKMKFAYFTTKNAPYLHLFLTFHGEKKETNFPLLKTNFSLFFYLFMNLKNIIKTHKKSLFLFKHLCCKKTFLMYSKMQVKYNDIRYFFLTIKS
jgi:hypothetical protein